MLQHAKRGETSAAQIETAAGVKIGVTIGVKNEVKTGARLVFRARSPYFTKTMP